MIRGLFHGSYHSDTAVIINMVNVTETITEKVSFDIKGGGVVYVLNTCRVMQSGMVKMDLR